MVLFDPITFASDPFAIYLHGNQPLGYISVQPQCHPIKANLHLQEDDTSIFHLSTDCPNIFLTMHRMEHPVGSYHDLTFIIKQHMSSNDPRPPKFLVFFNSHAEAQEGAEFLCQHLAPELCDKVKWFHSGMTDDF